MTQSDSWLITLHNWQLLYSSSKICPLYNNNLKIFIKLQICYKFQITSYILQNISNTTTNFYMNIMQLQRHALRTKLLNVVFHRQKKIPSLHREYKNLSNI